MAINTDTQFDPVTYQGKKRGGGVEKNVVIPENVLLCAHVLKQFLIQQLLSNVYSPCAVIASLLRCMHPDQDGTTPAARAAIYNDRLYTRMSSSDIH